MKKIYAISLALAVAASTLSAKDLSEARIYLNAGHGSWGPNDRPNATIPYPNLSSTGMPDTCGFYESNTNLWKVLKLGATLEKLGAKHENIMYSRVKNGPFPYVKGAEDEDLYNRPLSEICEEVCANNIDMFLSVHSNAATEGTSTNYPLYIYRGKDGQGSEYVKGSYEMAQAAWPRLYTNEIDVMSYYSITNPNLRGDVSFYGSESGRTDPTTGETYYGYLGVLKHNAPGFLSEGYFHTYQPARHRALNKDYCGQEGVRYARGIADYFKAQGETTGYIMGTIKDLHTKISNSLFNYASGSDDQWLPLNEAVVKLYKDGKEVATYNVDKNYNGVFVFENLAPGNYTLDATAATYKALGESYKAPITVKANETSYAKIYLESETYEPPKDVYYDYPEPKQDDNIGLSDSYEMKQEYTNKAISVLADKTVRRSILRNGSLYVLALDNTNKPYIYIIDPETQAVTKTLNTEGTQGSALQLADIAFTADNKLIGCNKGENQFSDDQVKAGTVRGYFRVYKWDNLDAAPAEWFNSLNSGNYYNAIVGTTLAVRGASGDCNIMTTAITTGTSRSMRFVEFNIVNNVVASTTFMNKDTSAASNYTETKIGADMQLSVSPRADKQYIIDGSNTTPMEFQIAGTNIDCPLMGKMSSELITPTANGATYFKYAKHQLMAAPLMNSEGKNIGVGLYDITAGLNKAKLIKTSNTNLDPATVTYAMATGVVDNADITLYSTRNDQVNKFTSKSVEQPAVKGIMAYDLKLKEEANSYTFTFVANSNSNYSSVIFKNAKGETCGEYPIPNVVKGANTFTLAKTDIPVGDKLTWEIKLTGNAIGKVAKLNGTNGTGNFSQGCVAINNSTESDKFGYVYVGSRNRSSIGEPGLHEYNYDLVQTAYVTSTESSSRRISLDSKGNVYVPHWSDDQSGIYCYDVKDINNNWCIFNHNNSATKNSDGLWSLNGVALGGSSTSVSIIGSGNDTWMYTYDEDYQVNGAGNNVLMYHLGENTEITSAPDATFGGDVHSLTPNTDCLVVASQEGGFWLSQTRNAGNNTPVVPSLMYFDSEGNLKFNSGTSIADNLDGSVSGGYALNKDESLLAISNGSKNIVLFDVKWNGSTPTLTYKYKFAQNDGFNGGEIYQIAFDAANNLYISGKSLGVYSLLNNDNTTIIAAKKSLTVKGSEALLPIEVSAKYNNDYTATLTWSSPSKQCVGYNLYYDGTKVATQTSKDPLSHLFTGILDGTHKLGVSAIYPNSIESGISEATINTSGVENIEGTVEMKISPNPTSGILNINSPEEIVKVQVYSMTGALVLEANDSTIDMSNLANGTYLVKVNNYKAVRVIKK